MRSGATDQGLGVSTRIERNMCALLEYRRRGEGENLRGRVADSIGRLTGSTPFIYIRFVVFGLWVVINLGLTPVNPFDPRFVALAMVTSVDVIFVKVLLIAQNRIAALADDRADRSLEICLLTEHEIT